MKNECKSPKSRPVGGGATTTMSVEKREWPKFSVSLSLRELEDDFTAMAGRRFPRSSRDTPKVAADNNVEIMRKVADTLIPRTLEFGRKYPFIVCEDVVVPHAQI
ncbi:hypothetical protein L6452_00798 [Arctium lappa]|uniref:Uncharacterized protein n=1 Tax=Arctium lappa TaxID=4217 RepID=A0ACB9FEC8_ARCLA|nr:hypothetical protein L6452_00798 [Arctium lappa]